MDRKQLDAVLRYTDLSLNNADDGLSTKTESRALVVHLDTESFESFDIPRQWLDLYVSGPALAARLWACFAGERIEDPLSYEEDNPVVLTVSSLTGSPLPLCETNAAAFRSPQNGRLMFNVFQSAFGSRLSACGYDALILCGRLRRLGTVNVLPENMRINFTEELAGMEVSGTAKRLGDKSLIIGPAGENRVTYAAAYSDGVQTGRGGLGCVLGLKNVKAVTVSPPAAENSPLKAGAISNKSGTISNQTAELLEYTEQSAVSAFVSFVSKSTITEQLKKGGSSFFVKSAASDGWAAVENFSRRTDPRLFYLASDETARRFGPLRLENAEYPYGMTIRREDGKIVAGYEAGIMLGANTGCFDPDTVSMRCTRAYELGLDPVSLGNVLGWAMDAQNRGLLVFPERISFSDNSKILPLMDAISKRAGYGDELSRGVKALGAEYGASEYAYHINGLECGPFDYRGSFANALNDANGNHFPVWFAMRKGLCRSGHAWWTSFNEELVLGLESMGLSGELVLPYVYGISGLRFRLASMSRAAARRFFEPKLISQAVSEYTGRFVRADSVPALGGRCRRLVQSINKVISMAEPAVPDHFCVDPDSSCKKPAVVPFLRLQEEYKSLIQLSNAWLEAEKTGN